MRSASILFTAALVVGCATGSGSQVTPDDLMAQAADSVWHLRAEQQAMDYFLSRAEGALVFPAIKRGGLIFGAVGGSGVLVERDGAGWGSPMFVEIGGINFGAQAGGEKAQVVVVIMNNRLIQLLKGGILDFGLGAGIALGPADLKAVGTLQTSDAYIYRSGEGVYGGLTVDSAVVKPDTPRNAAFNSAGGNTKALFDALAGVKR